MRRLILFAAIMLFSVGMAQRSEQAEASYQEAITAQQAALEFEVVASPDQPLWRDAIAKAQTALEQAPGDPQVIRVLAQTYSHVNWYVRAWEQWLAYLEVDGRLDDPVARGQFAVAGTELGYARYLAGDLQAAVGFYKAVLGPLPDNVAALTWLGRIFFEQDRPREALPYWQLLAELDPSDDAVRYYLERTEQRLAIGVGASDAFHQGIQAYEAGQTEEALNAFERALAVNSGFVEASVWAGRTSLELGLPVRARGYWNRVLEADPGDRRAIYFRDLAQAQIDWGVDAADAFYRGQVLYEQQQLAAANEAFVAAARANSEFADAWVWAARTHQELGNAADALAYWQGVVRLDPADERAHYFLSVAQQDLTYGVGAGQAYVDGVAHFQAADFDAAEDDFRAAVDVNPEFADAWGWLGRLFFTEARYAEAAEAYTRAFELEPGNDDYAFFAEESRRLAGE